VAQSPQNRQTSCRRCLLLSMTLQIRRQGGAKPGCSLSSLADDQMSVTKQKWGAAMTHDAICHQVMARRHSGGHLRCLHKRTELGILKHKICAHDHAIRSIARRCRSIVEPGDGLLQHALDAPRRRRDRHRALHFTRRERDARASRDGRIGLDGANGCTEADSYAGCGVGELMKHRLVVPAMDVMVQRAVIKGHVQAPARVKQERASHPGSQ